MDKAELERALADHNLWLLGQGGARADLRGADLRGANLGGAGLEGADLEGANLREANLRGADLWETILQGADLQGADLRGVILQGANLQGANLQGADLWNCVGNRAEVKSLQLDTYSVTYTHDTLQIGCKQFPITEWWEFSDARIISMDGGALEWWREWKETLRMLIEKSPAKQP